MTSLPDTINLKNINDVLFVLFQDWNWVKCGISLLHYSNIEVLTYSILLMWFWEQWTFQNRARHKEWINFIGHVAIILFHYKNVNIYVRDLNKKMLVSLRIVGFWWNVAFVPFCDISSAASHSDVFDILMIFAKFVTAKYLDTLYIYT